MKQGYEYKDGRVIVYDDIVKPTEIEYQDNIQDILNKENEIEFLESELKTLEVTHQELEEIVNYEDISNSILRYFMNVIITIMTLPIVGTLLSKYNLTELINLLGGVKGYLLTLTPIIALGLSPFTIKKCNEINYYKKEKNSLESQIEYIKTSLKLREIELTKLKSIKDKTNEPINNETKILDFNNIKQTKAIIKLIEDAGFEEKKYLEYLKKGILREKLSKYYEENEIKVIEHYIGRKAKSLSKKI